MSTAVTARAAPLLRRLGLSGAILLAAVLCDITIVASSVFDGIGDSAKDLVPLPGIVAVAGCAFWGRRHAVRAACCAAAILTASTALIAQLDVAMYSTLLTNVSFAETIAGVELLYFCARWARIPFAGTATVLLVAAYVAAALGRGRYFSSDIAQGQIIGALLLACTLVVALIQRRARRLPAQGVVADLVRTEWPLIGLLSLPLFAEVYTASHGGFLTRQVLLCSVMACALAVLATRTPVRAGLALAAPLLLSGVLRTVSPGIPAYLLGSSLELNLVAAGVGVSLSQVAAVMTTVVLLVRHTRPRIACGVSAVLTVVVALDVLININSKFLDRELAVLRPLSLAALLLLGISVAIGLFLRSRDSERSQVIRAAAREAQTSERMTLARELHDVVAHHVTGMVVQAQAAKMVEPSKTGADAFSRIENSGTEALTAMRRLVGSMRSDGQAEHASSDLDADLRALATQVNGSVVVRFELDIPRELPQELARSALRVTQEALTNTSKHAVDATVITVSASLTDDALHVRVIDDGDGTRADPAGGSGGYGLVGMRERVELLGGRLATGRQRHGGWCVELSLPVEVST